MNREKSRKEQARTWYKIRSMKKRKREVVCKMFELENKNRALTSERDYLLRILDEEMDNIHSCSEFIAAIFASSVASIAALYMLSS